MRVATHSAASCISRRPQRHSSHFCGLFPGHLTSRESIDLDQAQMLFKDIQQTDLDPILNDQFNATDGGSSKGKWISRAGWSLIYQEKSNQGVDLVRERDGDRYWLDRNLIVLTYWS